MKKLLLIIFLVVIIGSFIGYVIKENIPSKTYIVYVDPHDYVIRTDSSLFWFQDPESYIQYGFWFKGKEASVVKEIFDSGDGYFRIYLKENTPFSADFKKGIEYLPSADKKKWVKL